MTGDRFYVLRLISPRATFPADITPEEMTLMQAHVGYWSQFLKTGEAIVFGPVADPAGVWGLGVSAPAMRNLCAS